MMNQEDIFKKIGLILDELQDQYAYLAQNPAQLNELELELFMANANFLSDHVQIVQKLNSTIIPKALPEHTEVTPVEKPVQQVPQPVHQEESRIYDLSPANTTRQHESLPEVSAVPVIQEVVAELPEPAAEPEPVSISVIEDQPEPVAEAESVPGAEVEPIGELVPESVHEAEPEPETPHVSPLDQEVFKLDKEPSTFQFILKDVSPSDKFEFEEKSIDDIFDRKLSAEEEEIIARKQRLRAQQELELKTQEEEDEIGPEPFLVEKAEEKVPEVTTNLVADRPEEKEVVAPAAVQHAAPPVETTAAQPEHKLTLNEMLASKLQGGKNLNTDTSKASITDLKQGINLNDKMMYIRDLFNGYNLAYAEVIDLINKMPDFKTADAFLQNNYAVKNNWASKQDTVDKFYALLNQRFPIKG